MDINPKWTKREVYTCDVERGYTVEIRKLEDNEKEECERDLELWQYRVECIAWATVIGESRSITSHTNKHRDPSRIIGETRDEAMQNAIDLYLLLPISKKRCEGTNLMVRESPHQMHQ